MEKNEVVGFFLNDSKSHFYFDSDGGLEF